MAIYDTYPAVDENNNFPPVVREAIVTSPEMQAALDEKVDISTADSRYVTATNLTGQKGSANGIASLDADSKVPASQLPDIFGGGAMSGTFAQRPGAETVNNGTLYYSLDTTEVFRSNEIEWMVVGSGGTLGTAMLKTEWGSTVVNDLVPVPGLTVGFVAPVKGVKVTVSGQWTLVAGNNAAAYIVISINGNDGPHIVGRWALSNTEINYSRTAEITDLVPGEFATIDVKVTIDYRNPGQLYLGATDYNPHNLIVEAL